MTTTLYATFDGEVLRPNEPILLERDTRVRVTIEAEPEGKAKDGEPHCSLRAMLAANIDGPPDWSERIHEYLYGEDCRSGVLERISAPSVGRGEPAGFD